MGLLTFMSIAIALIIYTEAKSSPNCPPLYLRYSQHHSGCQEPNSTCNILESYLTEDDRDEILEVHNMLRNKFASGQENFPPCANMLQVEWDKELAIIAQVYAKQCLFKHDCEDCRRVQNFGVGQNLFTEKITNSPTVPKPNWTRAINDWYNEIALFPKNAIDPFISKTAYGHFTQVVWAKTWRIGCGYVLYKEGATYKKLYVCNYGPSGNMKNERLYKQGPPRSACPENSRRDSTCGMAKYPGLCKVCNAPVYLPEGTYIFYNDFHNKSNLQIYATGINKWKTFTTLSGNYLGIVLNGGEESTIVFTQIIKPATSPFCFVIEYRKGPNLAGQVDNNEATEKFILTDNGYEIKQKLPDDIGGSKYQFSQFSMRCSWIKNTQVKIQFSVPPGVPAQFFEIKKVYATEGQCMK